jgi:hypothetical protein
MVLIGVPVRHAGNENTVAWKHEADFLSKYTCNTTVNVANPAIFCGSASRCEVRYGTGSYCEVRAHSFLPYFTDVDPAVVFMERRISYLKGVIIC